MEWPAKRVRQLYIDFFVKSKEHTFIESSPVVPRDDPTLLFANSGMNQFKPIFLGQVDPKSPLAQLKRAANSQKCIRAGGKHNDLEDVGRDTYHHTFFEMLGNWSFGNYFKKEAIDWAWELLTGEYKLPKERLYATYFGGDEAMKLPVDEEAKQLWLRFLPAERVLPFGMKENFWEMGETGPCGPCSEIHFDRIGGRDASKMVNRDDPTVIEIWNLVFMQFNREKDRSLRPLPSKHVDTGMGLERLISILQQKMSNYDTDVFTPIFEAISKLTGTRPYTGLLGVEDKDNVDTAYRVIADHIRTLTFAIADGAAPGNEGRNYVLRRILRRAVRYGRDILKAEPGFFCQLVSTVVEQLKDFFPEIAQHQQRIYEVIRREEFVFNRTVNRGLALYKKVSDKVKKEGKKEIPGEEAFKLYDTYGFPLDLTELMAREEGFTVNHEEYEKALRNAKFRSNAGPKEDRVTLELQAEQTAHLQKSGVPVTNDIPKYNHQLDDVNSRVLAIFNGKEFVKTATSTGDQVYGLVVDQTNFYPESGGQVNDEGSFKKDNEILLEVFDAQLHAGYVLHTGYLNGSVSVGDQVVLSVNKEKRRPTMANHTFTHVLNFALRSVLGLEVDQKGSLVDEAKLRFDFSHSKSLSLDEITRVESICKGFVDSNLPVFALEVPLDMAKKIKGLRAVFGETYPNPVRVVSLGNSVEELLKNPENPEWEKTSIELCGGTHLQSTGQAVSFIIVSEGSISTGVRRIIAVTGEEAKQIVQNAKEIQDRITAAESLKGEDLAKEISNLNKEMDVTPLPAVLRAHLVKSMETLVQGMLAGKKDLMKDTITRAEELASKLPPGTKFVVEIFQTGNDRKVLDAAMKVLREKLPEAALLVLTKDEKTVTIMTSCPKGVSSKLSAGDWAKEVAAVVGGKGGGKPEAGQASGNVPDKTNEAIEVAKKFASMKL